MEIVGKIFKDEEIDFSFLNKFFMLKIRKDFIEDEGKFYFSIKSALMDTLFFEKLKLIKFEEIKYMEESKFEKVFEKYGNTFNSPVRRGIFLCGALTQMLLNKQYKERGPKPPFMKKLKGLKLDERDIKALLPAVQNKFEEYDSYGKGKRLVAEESYKYLFNAGDNWKMSVDEINFYFAGGMSLVNEIKTIIYPEDENDTDLKVNSDINTEEI